eukprot:superscaffoldBa00000553_g5600
MDSLRQKLERRGLKDVIYMVINHQGAQAQKLHSMLEQSLSENVTLYKQLEHQPDVWRTLNGEKDDFLIYDRFVTCVAVLPVTFHFHTPSLVKAMLRVRSKIRTANVYVGTAVMRALRSQRSVKQTHSLMQMLLQLWKKTLGMVTIMGIIMVMAIAMAMDKVKVKKLLGNKG